MWGTCYQRRWRPDSSSGFLQLILFGVLREYMLKRELSWELKWEKEAICPAYLATHQPAAGRCVGTTALHHLPPEAPLTRALKDHPGGSTNQRCEAGGRTQREENLFLLTILPSPLAWFLNGPSTVQFSCWVNLPMMDRMKVSWLLALKLSISESK